MTDHIDERAAAADAALAAPLDLSRPAAVMPGGAGAKVVVSARVEPAHSAWILSEAANRGVTPSALGAELIAEAIAARVARTGAGQQRAPLISVEALHRAIDALAAGQARAAA